MELTNDFEVPVGAAEAFALLSDLERIAPCMPGATLEGAEGDRFTGRVKVKVGPMQMTYRGTAEIEELDAAAHRAVVLAKGQELRGGGTAHATITSSLEALSPDRTRVTVHTDLVLTGKPAQFGRGVIGDVSEKLLGQFADCLAAELSAGPEPEVAPEPEPRAAGVADEVERDVGARRAAVREEPPARRPTPDAPIDLLEVAGGPVVRRLAPLLGVVVAVGAYLWWRSRRG